MGADRADHRRPPGRTPPAGHAPRDLFDLLLAARDPETGARRSAPTQLRDQVATMIIAGHETTGADAVLGAVSAGRGARTSRPAWRRRRRRAASDPRRPRRALPRLPFTRAVVNEALRLYPPAFAIIRQALEADDVAAGMPIPRGTVVMIAPWVLHRHHAPVGRAGRVRSVALPARARRRRRASPTCRSVSGRACASARSSR